MPTKQNKFAFIVPRFGESIAGGAETLVAKLALNLAKRGDDITILTTCAKDNRTWNNDFPEGDATEYGLKVKRFLVDDRNLDTWIPLQIKVSEGMILPIEEQLNWMQESVNSLAMYEYIYNNQNNFDYFFFAPYLFGTTFWGSLICPEKTILIPCLHNEYYAYTEVLQSMFRQVKGFLFNAEPEKELAESLYGNLLGGEVGMGFVEPEINQINQLKPYFKDNFDYILYVGRKETGKNLHILIENFIKFKDSISGFDNLKLVIAGGGSFSDVGSNNLLNRNDLIDLSQVSEEEKLRLIKYSKVLCQPSTNESFSIVIMEAWQLEVPVLVHSDCAVTKRHCIDSGGGLYFKDSADFNLVIQEILNNPKLAQKLGSSGKHYVKTKYSWDAVIKRFDEVMEEVKSL